MSLALYGSKPPSVPPDESIHAPPAGKGVAELVRLYSAMWQR
jgi:hypothetical protein